MTGAGTGHEKRKRPRTCAGCGEEFPKRDLLRIVRRPDGQVVVDLPGKTPGRGAYICRRLECLERALKRKQLSRSLKVKVPEELVASLMTLLKENGASDSPGGESIE